MVHVWRYACNIGTEIRPDHIVKWSAKQKLIINEVEYLQQLKKLWYLFVCSSWLGTIQEIHIKTSGHQRTASLPFNHDLRESIVQFN